VILIQGTHVHKHIEVQLTVSEVISGLYLSGLMGILYQYYCSEQAKHQDERLGIMTDLIQKIRLVKMHTWEPVFAEMVTEARMYDFFKPFSIITSNFMRY